MSTARKLLFLLFFLGFASNIGGAGTMASFNASTTNAQSTFASGSVVLTNTNVASGKVCFSNGTTDNGAGANTDDNHNEACEAAFNMATSKPGETATAELTLKNEGNLGGTLSLLVADHTPPSGVTTPQPACSNRDAGGTVYHGTGDICQQLQLTIQRWTDNTRTTAHSCVYGVPSGNTCTLDSTRNLKHFTETAAPSPGLAIGALDASGGNDTAWFTVTVSFPDGGAGADNAFQGRVATMAIQWMLEQA